MPRYLSFLVLIALIACTPTLDETGSAGTVQQDAVDVTARVPLDTDYFEVNGIMPERQITLTGRIGERNFIGQDADALAAAGARVVGSFETPPSTLYQYPDSDNYYFVCNATNAVFQIKLVYTESKNYSLLTPFGVGLLSFADELRAAGLTEQVGDAENQYFSYGYDSAGQLSETVGFYFTFNTVANAVTALDIISSCP